MTIIYDHQNLSSMFEIWLPKTNQIWTVYVKVDMANSKEASFNNTISSTLSLITVLFEDLFEAINKHKEFRGEKEGPKASITSLNKTNTCDVYEFNINIINDDEYNALQKELLMLFEAYCIFSFWEFFKNCFVF
jgi:hypothetical protein